MPHLNRQPFLTRHARDLLSGRPESLIFCCLVVEVIKDSGFLIGEKHSRYAPCFSTIRNCELESAAPMTVTAAPGQLKPAPAHERGTLDSGCCRSGG